MEAKPLNLQASRRCKYLLGSAFPCPTTSSPGVFLHIPKLIFHPVTAGRSSPCGAGNGKWEGVKSRAPKPAHALWLALLREGLGQEAEF